MTPPVNATALMVLSGKAERLFGSALYGQKWAGKKLQRSPRNESDWNAFIEELRAAALKKIDTISSARGMNAAEAAGLAAAVLSKDVAEVAELDSEELSLVLKEFLILDNPPFF